MVQAGLKIKHILTIQFDPTMTQTQTHINKNTLIILILKK
jgi:hypothetical protein